MRFYVMKHKLKSAVQLLKRRTLLPKEGSFCYSCSNKA